MTIMNVPERASVMFFLPYSGTSAYTTIVSMNIVLCRILAHIRYLESKHQGGIRYGNRTKLDEDTEVITNCSDVAPGCRQRPGFFQDDREVSNRYFSCSLNGLFTPKAFYTVLYFNDVKPAHSHTFHKACSRIGFTCSTPNLAMHPSFF